VYADYLDEFGDPALARAYRWCGENGKSPHYSMTYEEWWWMTAWVGHTQHKLAIMPEEMAIKLAYPTQSHLLSYPTFEAAMTALGGVL